MIQHKASYRLSGIKKNFSKNNAAISTHYFQPPFDKFIKNFDTQELPPCPYQLGLSAPYHNPEQRPA